MATYDEIMADIDARNPTKPGQYTGKPVPLNQKEYQKPLSRVERLKEDWRRRILRTLKIL